jgi:2-dehydro-3-deoxyphosphooctonate aldolase (KDO 8-P synthase)
MNNGLLPLFSQFDRTNERLAVMAGPCVVESKAQLETVAKALTSMSERLPVDFVFKASYRKANRTGSASFTGIGDDEALKLLEGIGKDFGLPTVTDIHDPAEVPSAAQVCDVLQIPAFLARQTALLHAAGQTGRVINIKKGQFMAPQDMQHARQKVLDVGNKNVLLCERGTFFGYGDLVVDMRSLEVMKEFGPVVFDATHSVQRPSQQGVSGGDRRFIPGLLRAAVASGVDGIFIETHPDPANAKSDKATQWPLDQLEGLLSQVIKIREALAR